MRATMILGAGPGGTGPLVWAAQNGKLDAWLAKGVTIVERSGAIGGMLGQYLINSDSLGSVYMECLDAPAAGNLFAPLREDPASKALMPMRDAFPPLVLVDRFLHRLGTTIEAAVERAPRCGVLRGTTVRALHLRPGGGITAEVAAPDGAAHVVEARTAIVALGGRQDMRACRQAELLPGVRLADFAPARIMPSDHLLTADGLARATAMLGRPRPGRVAILGGSHSAFSVAWVLTTQLPPETFDRGDILMLMRRPPRVYYESVERAAADGYPVAAEDICPRTQRVNRLGGLRGDGREVWRRLTGRPGTEAEPRVALASLDERDISRESLRRLLAEADLVIPAFGYRARTVPVFGMDGDRLILNAEHGRAAVGADARLLLADGRSLPNLFGIGLGSGFVPRGSMGGEASFSGQANSLWLYQNDIGGLVHRGVHECLERVPPLRALRRRRVAERTGAEPLPVTRV